MKKWFFTFSAATLGMVILGFLSNLNGGMNGFSGVVMTVFFAYCALIVVAQGIELITAVRNHFQQLPKAGKRKERAEA